MIAHQFRPLARARARARRIALWVLALTALLYGSSAAADDISKEACVDAHSRGQDAREQGRLSVARKLFITCAQSQCPALVQDDCARYADELDRVQPWLSFAARDGRGNDLPDTAVYVDEQLLLTRLDDGKAHAIDPGRHAVRFSHDGRDQVLTVVVGSGEKGRTVIATFETPASGSSVARDAGSTSGEAPAPKKVHAVGSRALIITGAALAVAGSVFAIVGLTHLPDNCSLSSHDCAAPPGDAAFGKAAEGVRWSNVGWTSAGVGAAALAAGLLWFFKSAKLRAGDGDNLVAPYVTRESAGLSFRTQL